MQLITMFVNQEQIEEAIKKYAQEKFAPLGVQVEDATLITTANVPFITLIISKKEASNGKPTYSTKA